MTPKASRLNQTLTTVKCSGSRKRSGSTERHRRPRNRHVRPAEWLLMPRDLAVCHQLSITGTQTRDGRATWQVYAEPLPADLRLLVLRTPRHGLNGELEIDAELGVVVAAHWKFDERSVEATTLLDLHAGESAAAQTFHFEPPPGADVTEGPSRVAASRRSCPIACAGGR